MDTFLVRTLLVPSTVIRLNRWNWWPSAMARGDGEQHARPTARALKPSDAPETP
jgi:uncharacterized membrane protein YdfJ with MMPL/SSD domain